MFFLFITYCSRFLSIFIDNKSLISHKTVETKVFLIFCLLLMEASGSGYVHIIMDPEAQKHPNPEYCSLAFPLCHFSYLLNIRISSCCPCSFHFELSRAGVLGISAVDPGWSAGRERGQPPGPAHPRPLCGGREGGRLHTTRPRGPQAAPEPPRLNFFLILLRKEEKF